MAAEVHGNCGIVVRMTTAGLTTRGGGGGGGGAGGNVSRGVPRHHDVVVCTAIAIPRTRPVRQLPFQPLPSPENAVMAIAWQMGPLLVVLRVLWYKTLLLLL